MQTPDAKMIELYQKEPHPTRELPDLIVLAADHLLSPFASPPGQLIPFPSIHYGGA